MGIYGFTSLVIPLKLAEPENFEHVFCVVILSLRACSWHWPFWRGPRHFLNFLLYWSPEKIHSFFFLDQVNQLVLISGSVIDQGTICPPLWLCYPTYRVVSISSSHPITSSEHLITNMVHVYIIPSGD